MTNIQMETVLRRASLHDQEVLANLWVAFMHEQAARDHAFRPAADAEHRWRNDLPEWLRDETRRVYVAEHLDEIVGFVTAQRWTPPPIYAYAEEVYLGELYVLPDARGEGVGRRLVQQVQAWAEERGAERVRMGVAAGNEVAQSFWRGLGAQPVSLTLAIECKGSAKKGGGENKGRRIGF